MDQTRTHPVAVQELQRAWRAVQAGQFRNAASRGPHAGSVRLWRPTGLVLPVVGCHAHAGSTCLAVAIATAADNGRVIECCTAPASGLAGAATAELGTTRTGWVIGRRGDVALARAAGVYVSPDEVPVPEEPATDVALTVLDVGWELGQVLASSGWLGEYLTTAGQIVATTTATVPGLRRLETALTRLGAERTTVAVLGPPRRQWPAALTAAMGPATRAVERGGRVLCVPHDKRLGLRGIDSTPLPAALLRAAQTIWRHAGAGDHLEKGTL